MIQKIETCANLLLPFINSIFKQLRNAKAPLSERMDDKLENF